VLITRSASVDVGVAVYEWNQIALAATIADQQEPGPQLRSMAIVQVAMHDAVNVVTRKHKTYLSHAAAPAGASEEAAAIAAAHTALVSLFANQIDTFDRARAISLSERRLTESDPGVRLGERVATAILAARVDDGASRARFAFTAPGSGKPGVWVALEDAPALLPGWANVTPWVLHSPSEFRPSGPPALDSAIWARDYNEVKQFGSQTGSWRTAEQTEIARFWMASPSVIWNGVARAIIGARGLDASDTAHVLAMIYLAASDAAVTCWDAKYTFNFWRPQQAIRSGDLDGNDETVGDPGWTPLFPTPPHPDYLSGHATNSSAMAMMLELFFSDDPGQPIVATSPTNPGFRRQWRTFSEGVQEVIDARIYSGLHYRTSDEVGAQVGRRVARFVFDHALREH
jgi:PAP2 superfamily